MLPSVSVIVPVFDDAERLAICLERLDRQSYPRDRYEVVVVDNGSRQSVAPLVDAWPRMRTVYEARAGSFAARNAGIQAAQGELLAFTDSDCRPRPDWIERGVANLEADPRRGLVGGRVSLVPRDPVRFALAEFHELVSGFPQRFYVESKHFAVTANAFTRRKVIDDVGAFRPELLSGGDEEWGQRIYDAGYRQTYEDAAVVEHPTRVHLRELLRKRMRTTGGRVQTDRVLGLGEPSWVEELRRLRRLRGSWAESVADHSLLGTTGNRAVFLSLEYLLQVAEMVEVSRLRLGGCPRRR